MKESIPLTMICCIQQLWSNGRVFRKLQSIDMCLKYLIALRHEGKIEAI